MIMSLADNIGAVDRQRIAERARHGDFDACPTEVRCVLEAATQRDIQNVRRPIAKQLLRPLDSLRHGIPVRRRSHCQTKLTGKVKPAHAGRR